MLRGGTGIQLSLICCRLQKLRQVVIARCLRAASNYDQRQRVLTLELYDGGDIVFLPMY